MLLKKINEFITARRANKPIAKTYAPYPVGLYQDLIEKIKKIRGARLTPFNVGAGGTVDGIEIYSRHDIDTPQCVENLPMLVEVDERNGVIPGVFFLVNDQPYRLDSCRDHAVGLRQKGYVVGLHTVCYLEDDYLGAFQREVEKFTAVLGFHPQTFNAHGLGKKRLETRLKFYEEISERYKEYGFSYSDCCYQMRPYQYVIEDCHWDENASMRYIKDDFFNPKRYVAGGKCLILTHPCYWKTN